MNNPEISVGILSATRIEFILDGEFNFEGRTYAGKHQIEYADGKILFDGQPFDKVQLIPKSENSIFTLLDVVIGIGFHWERTENQRFEGKLELIVEGEKITAINRIPIESYLISVISSEMSATSSLELLKAHAVISRSWMLSQIEKKNNLEQSNTAYTSDTRTETEWIKWWDREDHANFDVCADDHCQRYQGITRASTSLEAVKAAVNSTHGILLTFDGKICDARFSKCCGGAVEEFDNCWEPVKHPYLTKLYDNSNGVLPNLSVNANAEEWIRTSPEAFCNSKEAEVLSQVLNNYDQETADFYRWKVEYTTKQITDLAKRKIGVDFGEIQELLPLERGTSGRILRLKVVGKLKTLILGKELLIRKAFSESHLYSSAFVVDKTSSGFVLTGAGWGHGVGLCQIGAAVMAHKGYSYNEILNHYFPNALVQKIY
ncbi:SpoIID/LytB domain-containing protein [Alistipes sp. ZOR0009]|uniref:SpoIID/LytB domain-containing protein n=1 Tax=Alistipes sp. ZOR0009 TaxID=1339253 RepID=UPI0006478BD5|nr:SpoIID/LytB domain-containing protein [Alistipes sp. ZOR0009]